MADLSAAQTYATACVKGDQHLPAQQTAAANADSDTKGQSLR